MKLRRVSGVAIKAFLALVLLGHGATAASSSSGPKLPQLDLATYSSQVFWLIISFVVLYFLVAKLAMPRIAEVLEERQERCLLYTSPSPRDLSTSRMPSSA